MCVTRTNSIVSDLQKPQPVFWRLGWNANQQNSFDPNSVTDMGSVQGLHDSQPETNKETQFLFNWLLEIEDTGILGD